MGQQQFAAQPRVQATAEDAQLFAQVQNQAQIDLTGRLALGNHGLGHHALRPAHAHVVIQAGRIGAREIEQAFVGPEAAASFSDCSPNSSLAVRWL